MRSIRETFLSCLASELEVIPQKADDLDHGFDMGRKNLLAPKTAQFLANALQRAAAQVCPSPHLAAKSLHQRFGRSITNMEFVLAP